MASMLAGVECARRRRFHGGGESTDSPTPMSHGRSRRLSFCLYASSSRDIPRHSSLSERRVLRKGIQEDDEKLCGTVREARERLHERLRTSKKSDHGNSSRQQHDNESMKRVGLGELHTEVYGWKKIGGGDGGRGGGSGRFPRWFLFGLSRLSSQEDCSICLEHFRSGETVVNLPCAHKFHSKCLVPWLETHSHCPYCRLNVVFGLGFS